MQVVGGRGAVTEDDIVAAFLCRTNLFLSKKAISHHTGQSLSKWLNCEPSFKEGGSFHLALH